MLFLSENLMPTNKRPTSKEDRNEAPMGFRCFLLSLSVTSLAATSNRPKDANRLSVTDIGDKEEALLHP